MENNRYAIKNIKMENLEFSLTADAPCEGEMGLNIETLEIGELELTFEDIANILKMLKPSAK